VYTNDQAYFAANLYGSDIFGAKIFLNSVIFRASLSELRNHNPSLGLAYFYTSLDAGAIKNGLPIFNFGPVQNATTVMYWATHYDPSTMRIWNWSDTSNSIFAANITIPSYANSPAPSCPSPGGGDGAHTQTIDCLLDGSQME
jgi:hypothetical protein